jgi:hypothetical protein
MAVQIKQDGSFEVLYTGPWKGLSVQAPPNLIDDHEFPAMSNVFLHNGSIASAPNFAGFATPLANDFFRGMGSFQDASLTWHTFGITNSSKLYELTIPGGIPTWTLRNDYAEAGGTAAVSWRVFNGVLYWVDGTVNAKSWDGAATFVKGAFQVAGNSVGGFYIDELGQHVILLSTHENDGFHTKRIRWSAIGLPTQFDPAVNINAGLNDFIDVADDISGDMMLGRVGYIYHRTGIIEMAPTGVGTAPFDFNHVWNSQDGTGSLYPYCTCQFGSTGAFVSAEDVYLVQNYQFSPIGGKARDAIINALASFYFPAPSMSSLINAGATSQPYTAIIPGYTNRFPYLVLQIILPIAGPATTIYQYSLETQYWEQFSTAFQVTCRPAACFAATNQF